MATNEPGARSEAEPDMEEQSPSYHHKITIQPSKSETPDYDRTRVVFVKVPASMSETFASGPERAAEAVSELLDKEGITIDGVEQFSLPATDGMISAYRSFTPSRQSSPQTTLKDHDSSSDSLPEPLDTTYNKLKKHLPESLDIRIGTLPMDAFGSSPALGTRLVMEQSNQKPAGREKVSGVDANALFKELAGEPFLYHVLYRRSNNLPENYEYQVTVRIFLFNPTYKVSTESEYANCLQSGRKCDPADSFAELGVSSSLSVIDDGYNPSWLDNEAVTSARDSELPHFSTGQSLITGKEEFDQMRRGQYGASDILEERCEYTSLLARAIDLEHYVGLGTVDPGVDPWEKAPRATGFDIDDVSIDPDEILPEEVTIGVDAPIEDTEFDQESTTANDGSEEHWEAIKHTAVALETEGYDVVIVDQDTESRPDLWARRDDGEILAVEVEYKTRSKPGSFYNNLIRQAVWGYKTISVLVPETDEDGPTKSPDSLGNWAFKRLVATMKERAPTKTKLHNCTSDITVNGKTMLLPDGVTEANWWLTYDGTYLLVHDGELLAQGNATEPFEEFKFNIPRYYKYGNHYVVENKYGKPVETYSEESDIENTTLHQCHRPVDLSYIQFVETLYCYDPEAKELVQQDMTADWDVEQASSRNESSHQAAFDTFLIKHEDDDTEDDDPILEREVRSFIVNWIEQLSTHGHPGKQIYGQYRNDYCGRKKISTELGMEQSYPGVSFRYPRGLVSPDLPGLDTKPALPDRWNVAADDVLKEPLIDGLADRSEIASVAETEADSERDA